MKLPHCSSVIVAAAISLGGVAQAADTPEPARPDALAGARSHIQAKRWPDAIAELKRVNAADSADWNNLMGYSLRKQATPDFAGAERHYAEALRIDPKHRGALEYSGELALAKGDLPGAQARLATLDKLCPFSCAEYRELKKAIERHKAGEKTW